MTDDLKPETRNLKPEIWNLRPWGPSPLRGSGWRCRAVNPLRNKRVSPIAFPGPRPGA